MSILTLLDLSKNFDGIEAVKNVNLEIKGSELFVILGPSGAGKTTILRLIAGLEFPTRGEILFDGRSISHLSPQERNVAMIFESYALYPQMSVYENIAFPLRSPRAIKRSEKEIQQKVHTVAEILQIKDLLERLPGELSGGQKQRVAIGRTLVRDPSIFLMDEPIAHLDAKLRHELRGVLRLNQKELGITTLWTTPDHLEAVAVADRVAVLNRGEIQQIAKPEELYQSPQTQFIAGLIGDPAMNFIDLHIDSEGDRIYFLQRDLKFQASKQFNRLLCGLRGKSEIRMGIRPEDINITLERRDENSINGTVYVCEPFGKYSVITVDLMGHKLKAKTMKFLVLEPGEKLWFNFNSERICFFDPITGHRLTGD